MNEIKDLLYDECDGIFERLRNGNYEISHDEKQIIINFCKKINDNLKKRQMCTADEVIIAIDLVHLMGKFTEQEWPERIATEAYENMLRAIEFED